MSFAIDGKGYVVGGYDGVNTRADLWMYDPDLDAWSQRAPMPAPRRTAGAFAIGGKGYVACGLTQTATMHATLFEYDPVSDAWVAKAPFPGTPRYGVFSFALAGYGYVGSGNIGSGDGPFVSDAYRYDPATDSWSPIASLPGQARYGTSSFAANGKGYVHGGRVASLDFTNDLWEYDASSNAWTAKPAMAGPGRSWAMSMPFQYDAVVACGKDVMDANLYDAYRYVPAADLWIPVPDFPGNSGWGGASCALGQRVFGGLGRRILLPNSSYFNDWWELINVDANGISDIQPDNRLIVVPNPIDGEIQQIQVKATGIAGGEPYKVLDSCGRLCAEGSLPWDARIHVAGLKPGSYTLSLSRGAAIVGRFTVLR